MGIYYYLVNKTKREYVQYDDYVKEHNWYHVPVMKAIIEYMFTCIGDELMLVDDTSGRYDAYLIDYKEIDLKTVEDGINNE